MLARFSLLRAAGKAFIVLLNNAHVSNNLIAHLTWHLNSL
jgi:hypothetical protein